MRAPPLLVRLLALSRVPHSLLDVATPALAAVLWADRLPPIRVILIGLAAALAGYLTVYALNDLVDLAADRKRVQTDGHDAGYLDSLLVRHPLARGLLSPAQALTWTVAWGAIAAAGSLALRPICLAILVAACAAEAAYCRLACVSPLRALLAGVVKTAGPVAAVFAVDPRPRPLPLVILFLWMYLVEIGGQNIPADWTDVEQDKLLGARTIPLCLGQRTAAWLAVLSVTGGVILQQGLVCLIGCRRRLWLEALALALGMALLVIPAARLLRSGDRRAVFRLFNRASNYPAALLLVKAATLLV
jgi:4-hydroxybenzoate polyprenyltransferase